MKTVATFVIVLVIPHNHIVAAMVLLAATIVNVVCLMSTKPYYRHWMNGLTSALHTSLVFAFASALVIVLVGAKDATVIRAAVYAPLIVALPLGYFCVGVCCAFACRVDNG